MTEDICGCTPLRCRKVSLISCEHFQGRCAVGLVCNTPYKCKASNTLLSLLLNTILQSMVLTKIRLIRETVPLGLGSAASGLEFRVQSSYKYLQRPDIAV